MRGANVLFAETFQIPVAEKQRKGRSESMHAQRNACLIDRFVFYGKTGIRYELIVRTLSREFFLSEVTIPEIIDDNYALLQESRKAGLDKHDLKKKWPHLDWTPLVIVPQA